MDLSIGEVSKRYGVSIRTLRYYDEIGLFKPAKTSSAGYRLYDAQALADLQQILFYRELDLPLAQIEAILHSPENDRRDALSKHRELLLLKREQLDGLLRLVDETIGGKTMSKLKTTAADVQAAKEKYADEVRQKWGNTEQYRQSQQKESETSQGEQLDAARSADEIFEEFSQCVSSSEQPDSARAQQLVEKWQRHISENHYECSKEILACLGEMYTADERFTENLDRFGTGTAKFMSDAIKAYCS